MQATWVSHPAGLPTCLPGLIRADDGREYLPQTDWEWPSVAREFGWNMATFQIGAEAQPCSHDSTDGTVVCKGCGATASEFISAAFDYLVDNGGVVAEVDEVYFA